MPRFPAGRTDRQAKRDHLHAQAHELAQDQAATLGRSIRCVGLLEHQPAHAGAPGGCTDDGGQCICECHD